MIPAPLRAPPTGITDAGYRIRLGASVFCCSHGSMSRQPRVFQTAHRAVATESGWALLSVLEENAEPAFAQGYGVQAFNSESVRPPQRVN